MSKRVKSVSFQKVKSINKCMFGSDRCVVILKKKNLGMIDFLKLIFKFGSKHLKVNLNIMWHF